MYVTTRTMTSCGYNDQLWSLTYNFDNYKCADAIFTGFDINCEVV